MAAHVKIGAHVSGGVPVAAERAAELGCDCLQIFTSSPRQWRAPALAPDRAARMRDLCVSGRLSPLVVHANYLINLAGAKPDFRSKSLAAFRGELQRAAAIGADYLVLHPGSGTLERCVAGVREAAQGFQWGSLTLLIENAAAARDWSGAASDDHRLAGSFEELAAILAGLKGLPVDACIDTCHAWVAGYDLAGDYEGVMSALDAAVGLKRIPVFHVNDAKAGLGSHLDRHEHIGQGQLGEAAFGRLLRDPRCAGKAFILETPVDSPDDQPADLAALRRLL